MPRSRVTLWAGALLALALGAALRLWFIAHTPILGGDTFLYGDIALSWMGHGIYGFSQPPADPVPTLIRLPGYPLFLILCFRLFGPEHYTAVMRLQCVLDLFACLVLADLARRLFASRRSALLALMLAALCPFTASYVAAPLTETLTLACITLSFYALERWRSAMEAGDRGERNVQPGTDLREQPRSPWSRNGWLCPLAASLAYAILLRPEQGLLAAAILPAVFLIARRVARSAVTYGSPSHALLRAASPTLAVALGAVLPLLPWTVRNARTFHVFQPLAPRSATDPGEPVPTGFDHWYRTWAIDFSSTEDVYWNYDGAPIAFADIPARAFDSPAQLADTRSVLDLYNQTSKPSPEIEARFEDLARTRTATHPLRSRVGLPVARLLNMLLRPRVEMLPIPLAWWRISEHPAETLFAIAWGTVNLAYLVLGALGLYRWSRRPHDPTTVIAVSLIGYALLRCALLLTLDNSEPRYTLELFPILVLGIASLVRPSATRDLPRRIEHMEERPITVRPVRSISSDPASS